MRIRTEVHGARIRYAALDLASLSSVAAFAERLETGHEPLDLLINNDGVMVPPVRHITADGFELQLGTNYLGHFALTAHLLPLLRRGERPRVVSLGRVAARSGRIDFHDLNAAQSHKPGSVYSQSKLACVLFAFELQRRSGLGHR